MSDPETSDSEVDDQLDDPMDRDDTPLRTPSDIIIPASGSGESLDRLRAGSDDVRGGGSLRNGLEDIRGGGALRAPSEDARGVGTGHGVVAEGAGPGSANATGGKDGLLHAESDDAAAAGGATPRVPLGPGKYIHTIVVRRELNSIRGLAWVLSCRSTVPVRL